MSETVEQATETPVANARDDIRASLEAAYDTATKTEPTDTEPAADPAPAETQETTTARARDESGRFAKTEKTEETPPAEEKATTTATVEPPANWTAADKEAFKQAPAAVQEVIARRAREMEADYTRKTTAIAAFRRAYEPVQAMFEPHAEIMRQKGLTPAGLIEGWYRVEQQLAEGKGVDVIRGLMRGYNISPQQVAAAIGLPTQPVSPTLSEDGQPIPPPVAAPTTTIPPELRQTLDNVLGWISSTEQQRELDRQQRYQADAARVQAEIDRFRAAVDDKGKALHPYFADVEDDMVALAKAMTQKGGDIPPLSDLYDQAVWMNPVTRARLKADEAAALDAQRAEAERTRAAEARAKAAKAQRASAPVTGAPGAGQAHRANGELSLREQLERAVAERAA